MKWQKECPYCGKIYKSKKFYKKHIKSHEGESTKPILTDKPKESTTVIEKSVKSTIKLREVVYLGTADISTVVGSVTGKKYSFSKDEYKMPKSTSIDERDYPAIIVIKGKGCARRDPTSLFMSKIDWDLEIEKDKAENR